MALPRYERIRQRGAGPKMRRAFFNLIGLAMLIGLFIGIVWVIAGLLNFHVLR
jgi:hypothetical protein